VDWVHFSQFMNQWQAPVNSGDLASRAVLAPSKRTLLCEFVCQSVWTITREPCETLYITSLTRVLSVCLSVCLSVGFLTAGSSFTSLETKQVSLIYDTNSQLQHTSLECITQYVLLR
jgi:hypothetical protein